MAPGLERRGSVPLAASAIPKRTEKGDTAWCCGPSRSFEANQVYELGQIYDKGCCRVIYRGKVKTVLV